MDERDAALQVAEELGKGGTVQALDVVKELASQGRPCPKASSLRGLLRRWSRRRRAQSSGNLSARDTVKPLTWTADFQACIDQHKEDAYLRLTRVALGPVITSFLILLPGTLDFLQQLLRQGVIKDRLVGQTDHTFNVEWQAYVFGSVGVVLYRKIRGRWRKSYVPVLLTCRPREDKESYRAGPLALLKYPLRPQQRTRF